MGDAFIYLFESTKDNKHLLVLAYIFFLVCYKFDGINKL